MSRGTIGGAKPLPAGLIADPTSAEHSAPIFSTANGQTTPNRLVTRRTPTNFGVCCLIDLTQREHAARVHAQIVAAARKAGHLVAFDETEPYGGRDDADRPPRG